MFRITASAGALFYLVFVAFFALEGCGLDPATIPCESDSQCGDGYQCRNAECWSACGADKPCRQVDVYGRPFPTVCYEGFCHKPSEIPDAGTDGDSGKSSAICGEPCTPVPDGWSSMQAIWIGPVEKAPSYTPPELGGQFVLPVFTGRADLDAAPAECDVCSCGESTGKCTDLPSSIEVHAAMCGASGTSLPFDGPANWTGSCTNANSIPAGQKCPAGSSTLCTQSAAVAPLGAPVDEGCTPFTEKLPIARARVYGPSWKTKAVGYDVPGCDANESCMPSIDLPSGFRSCIYQHGEHECPASWNGDRRVVYEVSVDKPGFIDARDCSPCSCGAPIGSGCTAHFRAFEDGACSKLISDVPIASFFGAQCTNVAPGIAIGSKEISSLAYLSGVCEPIGGEPIGTAIPDPNQAVTFCCSIGNAG